MSNLTDTDTSSYLADFKQNYLEPMRKANERYEQFKELPKNEQAKANDIKEKYRFLSNFVATIEATLEQNYILKQNQK